MDKECESFDDLERKFYTFVDYQENDPDVDWEKNLQDESSESFQDRTMEQERETSPPVQVYPIPTRSRWDQKPSSNSDSDSDLKKYKDLIRCRRQLNVATSSSHKGVSESPVRYPCDIYPAKREYTRSTSSSVSSTPSKRSHEAAFTRRSWSASSSSWSSENSKRYKNNAGFGRRSLGAVREPMPCHKGYQLLGDSQMVRFSEQILGLRGLVTYTEDTNSRRISYCVSGQKIKDLKERILQKEHPLSDKLILLIGTNDMIYGTRLDLMREDYRLILSALKLRAKRIVLLTVPPVPKFAHKDNHMCKLREFNDFVISCADKEKVFVVDLASLFISYSDTVSTEYFEEVFGGKRRSNSRVDLIHLNRDGFELLSSVLDIKYFDKFDLRVT